jgi:hypothetical protein
MEAELPPDSESIDVSLETEDDTIAQVIPEGFEVGTGDAQVPFDDDLEEGEEGLGGIDISGETPAEGIAESEIDLSLESGENTADSDLVDSDLAADSLAADGLTDDSLDIPSGLKSELKTVLSYMDQLLESLPEDKIEEFAKSEYFDTYKKLFKELGLV